MEEAAKSEAKTYDSGEYIIQLVVLFEGANYSRRNIVEVNKKRSNCSPLED